MSEHPAGDRRPSRSEAQAPAGGRSSGGERSEQRDTVSEHPAGDRRPSRSEPRTDSWRALPEPGGPPPRRLADSLSAVTKNLGGAGGPALIDLLQRWPEVVGESLAAHCRPVALRDKALTIAADEPAWGAQLRWLEADLLRRLDEAVGPGTVARITVRIRPG